MQTPFHLFTVDILISYIEDYREQWASIYQANTSTISRFLRLTATNYHLAVTRGMHLYFYFKYHILSNGYHYTVKGI